MSSRSEKVNLLVSYLNEPQSRRLQMVAPSTVDTLDTILGVFDTEVMEYSEGSYDAVARRAVWVFHNGWLLTVGVGINATLSHETKKVNANMRLPFTYKNHGTNWLYSKNVNGWVCKNPLESSELVELINELSEAHGTPIFALPWYSWLSSASDEGEEFYSYYDDGDEGDNPYEIFYHLLNLLRQGKITNMLPWRVEVTDGESFISNFSDYARFFSMVAELEESGEWFVNIDEHCASCAGGTRRFFQENRPDMVDAPEFLTWGQNSQASYLPDGSICVEVYVDEFKDEKYLAELANKYGFNVPIPENEENSAGYILYE